VPAQAAMGAAAPALPDMCTIRADNASAAQAASKETPAVSQTPNSGPRKNLTLPRFPWRRCLCHRGGQREQGAQAEPERQQAQCRQRPWQTGFAHEKAPRQV